MKLKQIYIPILAIFLAFSFIIAWDGMHTNHYDSSVSNCQTTNDCSSQANCLQHCLVNTRPIQDQYINTSYLAILLFILALIISFQTNQNFDSKYSDKNFGLEAIKNSVL